MVVRLRPGSTRARIGPYADRVLSIDVTRPPVDGEATDAARRQLAAALGVAGSRVRLVAGARSRMKRYEIADMSDTALAERLAPYRQSSD